MSITNTIKVKTVADTLVRPNEKPVVKTQWIKGTGLEWLAKPKKAKKPQRDPNDLTVN